MLKVKYKAHNKIKPKQINKREELIQKYVEDLKQKCKVKLKWNY